MSLAPGMDHPAGADPPADNAARCFQYTSSDEHQSRPAPTMDDRVARKRPMTMEPSSTEAIPAGMAAQLSMGQGSTSHASKRCRLVRIVNDDNEADETAPSLVQRPHSRPDVASSDAGRVTRTRLPRTSSRYILEEQKQQQQLGGPGEGSSRRHTGALTCKFEKVSLRSLFFFYKV